MTLFDFYLVMRRFGEMKKAKLSDLIPDDRNANVGTDEGDALLEKSLTGLGLGRSILLDRNNRIIAGNKTTAKAQEIGIDDVIIVETDGTKVVAVKRTDIDLDSKQGRELALADNQVSQVNLRFDQDVVESLAADFNINLGEWGNFGFDPIIPEEQEIALPAGEKPPFTEMTFTLSEKQAHQVREALKAAKRSNDFVDTGNENSNGNALAVIVQFYLDAKNG